MSILRVRVLLPVVAMIALAACEDDQGPDLSDLPATNGAAVVSYLQRENYTGQWSLWPGTTRNYASTSAEHGVTLTTYVNDIAREAIEDDEAALPEGSIVVKENYMNGTLMAVTTMYKVRGFAPNAGDWFWLQHSPAGAIMAEGAVPMCVGCHTAAAQTDYLYLLR